MNTLKTTALTLLTVAAIGLTTGGCSWFRPHQPKSSWKIIEEGDRNPFIHDTPEVIKQTPTTSVEVQSGPVGSQ